MAPVAKEFEKIIHSARERKKNEALADKIFSKGRRQSAPSNIMTATGGSLASRVGVKKPKQQLKAAAAAHRRSSIPAGNVNGEWTHDLHSTVNNNSSSGAGSLSSRITLPGASTAKAGASKKKTARLSAALDRMERDDVVKQQVNIIKSSVASGASARAQKRGAVTIRGLAGPFAVLGQNFAPGTTAADVESAMTPVGGEMISCKVIKTNPFIIVEMVFASKEGGEKVIETFNNRTADGRIIKVFAKPGGYKADLTSSSPNSRDLIVDGTQGFPEDLTSSKEGTGNSANDSNRLNYNANRNGGPTNKRGRGFQKGGRDGGR